MAKRRANGEGVVRQRKDGLWEAVVSVGRDPKTGKLKRVSYYGKTQKEVLEKSAKARAALSEGTYTKPQRLTLGEWLDYWFETYKASKLRALTLDSYKRIIRLHLKPGLGHHKLHELTQDHIEAYFRAKEKEGCSPSSLTNHQMLLSNAFRLAVCNRLVPYNVEQDIERTSMSHPEMRTLTMTQFQDQFAPVAATHRLEACFVLAFLAGLRRGELLGLRWQDVDFEAETIRVEQQVLRVTDPENPTRSQLVFGPPKTHKARQAQEKLRAGALYHDQSLVFCQEDGNILSPNAIDARMRILLAKAGLPPMRLHDARHTFATWLLEQGQDIVKVSKLMGHTKIDTTANIYAHVTPKMRKEAATVLDLAFLRASDL